jgi:resuscitation-promoting factor RpfB
VGKFREMSTAKKVLVGLGVPVLLFGAAAAMGEPPKDEPSKELIESTASVKDATVESPTIETKTVAETEVIPFQTETQNDSSLPKGRTKIAVAGVNGEKTITFKVTYEDGVETDRQEVSELISKEPVTQIKKIGTKVAAKPKPKPKPSNCDPNYSGACVPIASDVDCASGSGNGPAYVSGPVYVTGTDIYDLDRDGDGVGCE